MELKKIIFSLSVIFLLSCTERRPEFLHEYIMNNQSGVDMNMILYRTKNDTINIANGKEYRFEFTMKHGYGAISSLSCDSLGLIFDNDKKKMYKYLDKSNRNPLLTKSFVITVVTETQFLFRYTFTEEDYKSISN